MTETHDPIRIWIAAYTGPNAEIAVRDAVAGMAYPVLLPTALVEMTHARQTMMVNRPVFPRYAFIGVPHGMSWYPLKAVTGVAGILSSDNEPRAVPAKQIELLKAAMQADAFTEAQRPDFHEGQAVQVRVGKTTVAAFVAEINAALPAKRIEVLFSMFGKQHRRSVALDQVRAA